MTDTIFVTGLALHAYHGVMQHEAKVGQTFRLDLVLDIDLARGVALRQARRHRGLRPGRRGREPGVLRTAAIGWSRPRPARSPTPCSSASPGRERARDGAQAACADRRDLRRCRRHHHARPRSWLRRCSRSAAMSATCATRSSAQSRCSATAATCACSRARRTTAPRPGASTDQPPFVNLCIAVETSLTPHALLARAQAVERALGRDRANERRWGPRPVDIDLLAYDDVVLDEPDLTLPHPRLFERAFVLVPLAEIAPDRMIAGIKVRDALARVDADIEKLAPRR